MGLTSQDIATIVAALQDSDWDEAVVVVGDARIAVARNGARLGVDQSTAPEGAASSSRTPPPPEPASPAPAPTPRGGVSAAAGESSGAEITSPTVGVFWSSPEPGADAFVTVGDRVEVGDTVCIVEVMKLMTNVTSTVAGRLAAVLVGNGDNVEFGTPLFRVIED